MSDESRVTREHVEAALDDDDRAVYITRKHIEVGLDDDDREIWVSRYHIEIAVKRGLGDYVQWF